MIWLLMPLSVFLNVRTFPCCGQQVLASPPSPHFSSSVISAPPGSALLVPGHPQACRSHARACMAPSPARWDCLRQLRPELVDSPLSVSLLIDSCNSYFLKTCVYQAPSRLWILSFNNPF